jgi:hypothetical protein
MGYNGPGYPQARILEINLFIPFHKNSAVSKRRNWRRLAFADCADSYSLFSFSGFYRACRLSNVHSIRVLSDFAITSGHLSIFEDEKGGFPQIYPIYSLRTNQFSGQTANLICFIARKNHLNPMKIIHLFSC